MAQTHGHAVAKRPEGELIRMTEVLGIDIGGVIMDGVREDAVWNLDPPTIEGSFTAVSRLHRERFRGNCWLVSRCEELAELDLMKWLMRHDFFEVTGIDPQRVAFCRQIHEKAELCRTLEVTHFIDDRLAVLSHMVGVVPNLYCFVSRASEPEVARRAMNGIETVHTWKAITNALLDSPCGT